MSRLAARELTAAYGRRRVIEALSHEFADGKITAILGPNGCGKSTLLRSLIRLHAPRGGAVYLDGRSIHHLPTKEVARQLGLLAQRSEVPEGIEVTDLVRRGRFPHSSFYRGGASFSDLKAMEKAMHSAGVWRLRHRCMDTLSGGQKQRVWLAMALAQETPLLLLDEPTTYLDPAHKEEMLTIMLRLNRDEGRTILTVLHDINDARGVAHRVILMKEGGISASGNIAQTLTPKRLRQVFGVAFKTVSISGGKSDYLLPFGSPASFTVSGQSKGATLDCRGLTVSYEKAPVLKGISATLPAGKITAIIGANACGKSTLIKALAGALRPDSGTVTLNGQNIRDMSPRRRAEFLAVLPQQGHIPRGVVTAEMIGYGRLCRTSWRRRWSAAERVWTDKVLEDIDALPLRNRQVAALSGGQAQRVRIGIPLAQDASVLLLDEPTSFLDVRHQSAILDLLAAGNRRAGLTLGLVLHDLWQVGRYADNVIMMKEGSIIAQGPPVDVMTPDNLLRTFGIEYRLAMDPAGKGMIPLPLSMAGATKK